MLNRSALIIRCKQPFVDWINAVNTNPEDAVTLSDANQENTVYLVEVEDPDDLEDWIELNYDDLFEEELYGWIDEPSLWPQDRTLELFQRWCAYELHSVVFDTGSTPIEDEDD
ncbi:MAG: hypothetical protein ACRERS_08775 [Methylococcales bacterium]